MHAHTVSGRERERDVTHRHYALQVVILGKGGKL